LLQQQYVRPKSAYESVTFKNWIPAFAGMTPKTTNGALGAKGAEDKRSAHDGINQSFLI